MANNISVKDALGVAQDIKTTDNAGVHTHHHIVDSSALPAGAATEATLADILAALADPATQTTLADILAALADPATQTTLAAIQALLPAALVGGRLDVNVGAALPAGTNGIGKLTANSGVDIGDVDVTSLPALVAGEAHVGQVGGVGVVITASFTRAVGDTTQYASGDVVNESTSAGTVMTFTNCARANGLSGFIAGALLVDGANQATKGSFELWLFSVAPTADNDNAVFTPTDAELLNLVGIIPFSATAYVGDATSGLGGNCVFRPSLTDWSPVPFVCAGGSRNLYGVLVVRSTYTPVAEEPFSVLLRVDQN